MPTLARDSLIVILSRMLCPLLVVLGTCSAPHAIAAVTDWKQQAAASVAVIQGRTRLPGLHHPVRIQRDTWGVAHIYADDQHDLFFAQGFVAAQDRLFQMELWKRSGQGRLAEILGPSAVESDINARRLRYRGDMVAEYASYAPDTREILEAYTAGINADIDAVRSPGGRMPVEFSIAGFKPEHWSPEDCLNRVAAYSMTGNASSELEHAQAVQLLGAGRASGLFQFDPKTLLQPAAPINFEGLSAGLLEHIVSSDRRIIFPMSALQGSNNWTISGALTLTGKPLLANDPHRVISQPSLRYIVHLVAPGWNVIGAGEPALPGVAVGHNEHIAWGFTIFGLDQQDLYLETLKEAGSKLYRTAAGWTPMKEVHETIRVRGKPDRALTLYFTDHGPVLWENGNRALSLRWVGSEPGTAGYLGSLSLDRARNWEEFEAAMPRWKVPSENIVFADRTGNIGEHSTGLAPLRKNFDGLLPVPANGGFEWTGFLPNSALPHSYNPGSGFIASANQKMIPDAYPYAVGYEWAAPSRFQRIEEVLNNARQAGRKLTVADMQALQTDVVSLPARDLKTLLSHAFPETPAAPGVAAGILLEWDCALRADSAAAALYELWTTELRKDVSRRVVPEAARVVIQMLPLDQVVAELVRPRAEVFGPQAAATRDATLRDTLQSAYQQLVTWQGSDPKRWSWGALHKVYFHHALDSAGEAASLFDRGPVERPGDGDVVQATAFDDGSFDQIAGASYREIFDLSDWDNAAAINVPGQSGQPGSRHFDDLLPLWSTGRYFPLKFTRAAVDAVTTDTLTLEP